MFRPLLLLLSAAILITFTPTLTLAAGCLSPPGDVNASGTTNVTDVQCLILVVLNDLANPNSPAPSCAAVPKESMDVDCDNQRNVNDVIIVINYGLQSPLSLQIDTNQNQCPDTCENQCAGKADGTPCDADSSGCTQNDSCSGGLCVAGAVVTCADGIACTANTCTSTGANSFTCTNPVVAGNCLINNECYDSGALDPGNPCLVCKPGTSLTTWTPATDGTGCDADGDGCTVNDSCQSGSCTAGDVATCDDGLVCTSDTCASTGPTSYTCDHPVLNKTCLIGGLCYDANQANPENSCQSCKSSVNKTGWTNKADSTSCNADGSGCTQNDVCLAGVCTPGAAPDCKDTLGCTVDACTSTGTATYVCAHVIESDKCLIDGECWASGADNPDNTCLQCKITASQTAWSPKNNGVTCDADNNGCTQGDVCTAGVCVAGAAPNCNDNKACTTDGCTSTGASSFTCTNTIQAGKCLISGTCRNDGIVNPTNVCQECAPSVSTTQWSSKPNGTACESGDGACTVDTCVAGTCTATSAANCNDGKPCTTDACDGVTGQCVHTVPAGSCLIDGICYVNNDPNPTNSCQSCKPAQNKTTWSSVTNGTACDADNNGCTANDQCTGGLCVAGAVQTCDDGLSCTTGTCTSTGSTTFLCDQKVLNGTCAVGGLCYSSGASNPQNSCQKCAPSQSKTAWSNKNDGIACDADNSGCTVGDSCFAGQCVQGAEADCNDGAECTVDVCSTAGATSFTCSHTVGSGFCLIDNACIAGQAENPEDPCQRCKPAVTKTAWSASPDGTPCDADQNGCTVLDACAAGVCQPGVDAACGDGLSCTSDVCTSAGPQNFSCDHSLLSGNCVIDGECMAQGTTHPENPCQSCRPTLSTVAWSNKNDGADCDKDGSMCTDDACTAGVCVTVTTETCDDTLSCTKDSCDPATGTCGHTISGGSCLIDATCWPGQVFHPQNPCLQCKPALSKTAWSPTEDGTACNADNDGCTENDSCQAGVCAQGAAPNCGDKLGCTTDGCVSQGANSYSCIHTLETNKCLIDGECFASGADNPDNACQQCKVSTTTAMWSAKNNGVGCDADNNGCTQGDTCQSGVCTAGPTATCNDNKACTTDTCVSSGPTTFQCTNGVKSGKCLIGGTCVNDGGINPQNTCQECAPTLSTTVYSARPNGTACDIVGAACTLDVCTAGQCVLSGKVNCNDGVSCTTDSCSVTLDSCVNTVAADFCLIEGTCWAAQATNPENPCQSCKPATSKTTWSNTTNGTACNADNDGCTAGDACSGGLCVAGAAANCSDGLTCTTDACQSSGASTFTCTHDVLEGFCATGGACYTSGTQNPNNVCEKCSPSKSQTSFSPRPDDQACNADSNGCTVGDTCQAGVCVTGPAPNCTDGLPCTDDVCLSTGNNAYSCNHPVKSQRCLINSTCFKDGEENPTNGCQHCKSTTSTTAFTNKNNNVACEADSDPCTDMDVCQAGSCVASAPSNCDDGSACTLDSCVPFVGCHHDSIAIFVDADNAATTPDGQSWATAFPTIRQALLVAQPGDQVFVAEGTYYYHPQAGDEPVGKVPVVDMKSGVDVFGGFVGTECSVHERPYPLAETTLSADQDKDGVFDLAVTPTFIGDNLVPVRAANDSTLDGFVIGGVGGPNGASPYVGRVAVEVMNVSNFTLRNCKIVGNSFTSGKNLFAVSLTAIVAVQSSSDVLFDRCEFVANVSSSVDPVFHAYDSTNIDIRDSLFLENESMGFEMAVELTEVDGAAIKGTRFWGNQALNVGQRRVIALWDTSDMILDSVTFYGNTYVTGYTGFLVWANATPDIIIRGVSAWMPQVGWYLLRTEWSSTATVSNSALFGGTTVPASVFSSPPPVVEHSCFYGLTTPNITYGDGNVFLSPGENPFVVADQRLYLAHAGLDGKTTSSACVDAGSDAVAMASALPYWALSTRSDGGLDSSPVDMGAHSLPCDMDDSVSCATVEPCLADTDCNDGLPCTTDVCTSMGTGVFGCTHTYLPNGTTCGTSTNVCAPKSCQAGACVAQNPCEDGLSCTNNTCTANGSGGFSCGQTVANGTCYVNNICYVTGNVDPNNVCKECKPGTSKTTFSNRNNGTICDNDGDPCTVGSVCSTGVCGASTGTLNCDDQSACTNDFCTPMVGCGYSPTAIFVDDDTTATTPDGTSWAQAYPTITAALAKTSVTKVIYVAEGMYVASVAQGSTTKVPALDAKSGITVVGGFVPGQCAPEERTFPLPPSILTGDIDQDGVFTSADSTHTLRVWNITNVVIDGFTMGPGATDSGSPYSPPLFAEVYNADMVTLRNLTASGLYNTATGGNVGSAVRVIYSQDVVIDRCVFDNNTVTSIPGGGLGIDHSNTVTVKQCSFTNNVASHGGGLAVITTPNFILEDSTFMGNEGTGSSFYDGGAVFMVASNVANIHNCTFINNTSAGGGGGIYTATGGGVTISGSSFYGNSAATPTGQDIWGYGTAVTSIINCAFYPADPTKASLGVENGATLTSQYCCGPNISSTPTNFNVVLSATANPFTVKGPRLYLQHAGLDGVVTSSPCVNAGSDSWADTAGILWSQSTTRIDGVADTSPVDIGVHYVSPCTGLANGAACDDSDPCTLGETCVSGACVATITKNCSDGLSCTTDTCVATSATTFSCNHTTKPQRCLIDGVCINHGATNDTNPCWVCDVDQSQSAWSNQLDGALCTLDGTGCTVDVCAAGLCTPGANTACDDGLSCTTNTCSSTDPAAYQCATTIQNGFCALGGACYTQNQLNPDNGCQNCKPAITKSSWTPRADGVECEGDGYLCVLGETCVSGVCVGGVPVDCDDSSACTVDSCAPSVGCIHEPLGLFVNVNAPGPVFDGKTWATAFTTIQEAVDVAESGDEIWVAAGEYWSSVGMETLVTLKPGVKMYGGFLGTECDRAERPEPPAITRLIGDSDKDAVSETTDALYLMIGASDSVIDGFYFGGTAGPDGLTPYVGRLGLVLDEMDNVTVRNCTFDSLGYFTGIGGGARVDFGADLLFADCMFINNDGSTGSGVSVSYTDSIEFRSVTFKNNTSFTAAGGLDLYRVTQATVRDCFFAGNSASGWSEAHAGALCVTNTAQVNVFNSTFAGNTALVHAGAITARATSASFPTSLLISGCSFYENEAGLGGALYVGVYTTAQVVNSATFANKGLYDPSGDEFYVDTTLAFAGTLNVSYTCAPVTYAGVGNILLDPITEDPFVQNDTKLFLKQPGTPGSGGKSPCVNAGSSAAAADADIPWKKMTTRADGVTDHVPIDMGAHYTTCSGKADGVVCSDSDPCTLSDVCINEVCQGTPKVCDDGDSFTLDSCGSDGVCVFVPDCDDGDPCTVDTGEAGQCYHNTVAIFVDGSAPGPTHDGTSWATAFLTVADAMAVVGNGQQVFVANGTYKAKSAKGNVMSMKLGTMVYGGFVGSECSPDDRPTPLALTILDGDWDGDGVWSSSDSEHVVVAAHDALLDGFTIRGGANYGDSSDLAGGAGLRIASRNNFVGRNLTIVDNYSEEGPAGGVFIAESDNILIENSTISSNKTSKVIQSPGGTGGAMVKVCDTVTFRGVTFEYNDGWDAGALRAEDTVFTDVEDCVFRGNLGKYQSAGISLGYAASYTTITNSSFYDNDATAQGGAIGAIYAWIWVKVSGCSFYGNSGTQGGAIYSTGSPVTVVNSAFFGNNATTNIGEEIAKGTVAGTKLDVTYSCLPETVTGTGNVLLNAATGNPFTVSGSKLYLSHAGVNGAVATSACVNAGSNSSADVSGIDWKHKTTRADGLLDVTPVDMGVHYAP